MKAVIVDRWPAFIQTGIPSVLDYPIRSLVASWSVSFQNDDIFGINVTLVYVRDFVSGLIAFVYANTWYERLRGLGGLISASRR